MGSPIQDNLKMTRWKARNYAIKNFWLIICQKLANFIEINANNFPTMVKKKKKKLLIKMAEHGER